MSLFFLASYSATVTMPSQETEAVDGCSYLLSCTDVESIDVNVYEIFKRDVNSIYESIVVDSKRSLTNAETLLEFGSFAHRCGASPITIILFVLNQLVEKYNKENR